MNFRSINPTETPLRERYAYLTGVIGPRPIALASTLDRAGNPNLAPFSYFNLFSAQPPIVIFSPNRSGRTNELKDTARNVIETGEVVINLVSHAIVEQQNLASCEYPRGVNEFEKAGLTPLASTVVKPARVAESPAQLECTVREVMMLGTTGGSGVLVICEVKMIHLMEAALDPASGAIDPHQLDLVARMGGNWYCRAQGDALFEVEKAVDKTDLIGIDALPAHIRNSEILSGNDLGKLANRRDIPTPHAPGASLTEGLNGRASYHRRAQAL
ncbi:MAG: flavin reductase family protein, partial [bacterium]